MRNVLLFIAIILGACTTKQPVSVEETKPSVDEYYQRALSTYHEGELTHALQTAESSLKIYPDHAYTHQLVGLINQRLGNKTLATENFGQALKLAPKDASIANNFASLLCARKNYTKAERYYLAAANNQNNEQPDIAWTNAGLCAQRANQPTRAKSYFDQAIKLNPGQTTAAYQLAKLELSNNNLLAANSYLQQYLEHATHTAKTLLLGARIENAQGNPGGVARYVEMLRATFPSSTERNTAEQLTPITKKDKATSEINLPSAHGKEWIKNREPTHYTILIASNENKATIANAAGNTYSHEKAVYSVNLGGKQMHNLITGDFQDFSTAQAALAQIKPAMPKLSPWIRTFESIQAILKSMPDSDTSLLH